MLRLNDVRIGFTTLLLTIFTVGCATTGPEIAKPTPLAANDLAWLREQPEIVVIHHQTPGHFWVEMSDAGANFLEGFGAQTVLLAPYFSQKANERLQAKAIREGEKIRMTYSIADPVREVKARFVDALPTNLGLKNLRIIDQPATSYEPYQLADSFGSAVALDFITSLWTLYRERSFNPFAADRYYLRYAVHARLLRLEASKYHGEPQSPAVARLLRSEDSKILWQASCVSMGGEFTYTRNSVQQLVYSMNAGDIPRRGGQPYTLKEWTANGAALLKGRLNEVADACAQALLADFSG